jgi:hypothetical protein
MKLRYDESRQEFVMSRDLIVFVSGMQALYILILAIVFIFYDGAFTSTRELLKCPPYLIFISLIVYALYVFFVRCLLILHGMHNTIAFRLTMVFVTIAFAIVLFATRMRVFFILAPALLFDLLIYIFPSTINIASSCAVKPTADETAVDIVALYRTVRSIDDASTGAETHLDLDSLVKKLPEPSFDTATTVAFLSSHVKSKHTVGLHEFVLFLEKRYVNLTSGVLQTAEYVATLPNFADGRPALAAGEQIVLKAVMSRMRRVLQGRVTIDTFADDVRDFKAKWDGINVPSRADVDAVAFLEALRRGGTERQFVDLPLVLERVGALKEPPSDYDAFFVGALRRTPTPRTVFVRDFSDSLAKQLGIDLQAESKVSAHDLAAAAIAFVKTQQSIVDSSSPYWTFVAH